MVENLLVHGRFKKTHDTSAVDNVPNNAGAIVWGWNGLGVSSVDFDVRDSSSVLFKGTFHNLSLSTNSPDSNLTLLASWNDLLAIWGASNGSYSVIMCIIDGKKKLSWLWQEWPNLSIIPAWEDWLSISWEENAVALEAWYFNSEKLLSSLCVPDSNVVDTASGEELRVSLRESNIVDLLVVTSVSQLWANVVSVAPVDSGLGSSTEEMSWISCKWNWSNGSHDLCLFLNLEVNGVDLSKGSISWSEKEVAIRQQIDAVDSLWEESLIWSNPLEQVSLKWNLYDITSLGSEIGKRVSWINDATSENSLDLVHENLIVLNLLLNEIAVPGSNTEVVDGQALWGGIVEEADLVGDVHTNWVSNQSFAALNIPDNERVVILAT